MSNKDTSENLYLQTLLFLLGNLENTSLEKVIKGFPEPEEQETEIINKAVSIFQKESDNQPSKWLRPIFDVILKTAESTKNNPWYFEPQAFDLSSNLMPAKEPSLKVDSVIEDLAEEIQLLRKLQGEKVDPETLLFLLKKYTVMLPEPTGNWPGVAFYDYVKFIAGTAICMHSSMQDSPGNAVWNKTKPFKLIRTDISGIQNFIFDITSKHAAKNLKGRSFYVRLLSDSILYLLLNRLGLFLANVIYDSGGNFLLLAPNTRKVNEELDVSDPKSLSFEITDKLFQQHGATITAVIDSVELSAEAFQGEDLKEAVNELFLNIDQQKKQKFAGLINSKFDHFFDETKVGDKGGSTFRDALTGEEIDMDEPAYYLKEDGQWEKEKRDDADLFKEGTKKQIDLGKHLKNTLYWIITNEVLFSPSDQNRMDEFIHEPADMGVFHYLVTEDNEHQFLSALKNTDSKSVIYRLNKQDILKGHLPFGKHHTYGATLYGGNKAPVFECRFEDKEDSKTYQKNNPKTFNHLAYKIDPVTGEAKSKIKRLGVLRMDVDGLGWLFSDGIPDNLLTLLTYASLSRSLDTFFTGMLNNIWEDDDELRYNSQIIYSGGDDLFIVGRWDVCIHFAELIHSKFLGWTCQQNMETHPQLSVSGGIAVVTHKFPIIKGAEFAHDSEQEAKNYSVSINNEETWSKNAFTLWKPLNWQMEYPIVKDLGKKIWIHLQDDNRRQIFHKITAYHEEKLNAEKHGMVPRWKWQIAYDIARAKERYKGRDAKDFRIFLDEIKTDIFCDTYQGSKEKLKGKHDYFDLLRIAIRWTELKSRTLPAKSKTKEYAEDDH